jgi:hypothetical protein
MCQEQTLITHVCETHESRPGPKEETTPVRYGSRPEKRSAGRRNAPPVVLAPNETRHGHLDVPDPRNEGSCFTRPIVGSLGMMGLRRRESGEDGDEPR